jgi:hypothetical protein
VAAVSILDLIDGAVEAWETSPDAMRWSAEPEYQRHHLNEWISERRPWDRLNEVLERALADAQQASDFYEMQRRREDLAHARAVVHWMYFTPLVRPSDVFRITAI